MELWFKLYFVAVFGSWAARVIWWLGEHEPEEVFLELRLGFWRYFKEDLFAGLGVLVRIVSGNRELTVQSDKIQATLDGLAREHGYESWWKTPEGVQRALTAMARAQLVDTLPGFDKIVERLGPSQAAVRRFAWAAAMFAWLSAPCKMFMSVVSAQVGCLTSTVTLSGRLSDKDTDTLGLTYWRNQQAGLDRLDVRWCPDPSDNPSWFLQFRADPAGERIGTGINWRADLGHNVSFGFLGRVFSQGIRGTPDKPELSLWPSISWQVSDTVALGGFVNHRQPIGGRGTTSFGPQANIKLSDDDLVILSWWLPGANPEVDLCHTVSW